MATTKFLDLAGFTYFWGKIKTWARQFLVSDVSYDSVNHKVVFTRYDGTNNAQTNHDVVTAATIVLDGGGITSHQDISGKADIASPTFTGTPTAPTAASGTNTTQIATTAFVQAAVSTAVTGSVAYQGIAPTTFAPTNYQAGWYWIIGTAGTYVGETCEVGDMIFCKAQGTTYSASDFDVVQTNLDIASITNGEIDTITSNTQ